MRAWVARYAAIHTRYEPVFHSLESDRALAERGAPHRRGDHHADPRAAGDGDAAAAPARPGDPAAARDREPHAGRQRHPALPPSPARTPSDRVELALTDVIHRTLFGLDVDVNVHAPDGRAAARARRSVPSWSSCSGDDGPAGSDGLRQRRARRAPGRGARRVRRAGLPGHPGRRPRDGRRGVARRLLPVLPQQGGARTHPHRARGAGRRTGGDRDPGPAPRSEADGQERPAPLVAQVPRRARQRGGDAAGLDRCRAGRSRDPGRVRARCSTGAAGGCRGTWASGASATSTSRRS